MSLPCFADGKSTLEPAGWLIHAWGPGLPLFSHLAQAGEHEASPHR